MTRTDWPILGHQGPVNGRIGKGALPAKLAGRRQESEHHKCQTDERDRPHQQTDEPTDNPRHHEQRGNDKQQVRDEVLRAVGHGSGCLRAVIDPSRRCNELGVPPFSYLEHPADKIRPRELFRLYFLTVEFHRALTDQPARLAIR